MNFSYDLTWNIGRMGGFFIMPPFYEYKVIGLGGKGHFYHRHPGNDREIEE